MKAIEDFELARTSLLDCVCLLRNVKIAYPEAEAKLHALAHSEATDVDLRSIAKVLHALGTFALAQDDAELRIRMLADSISTSLPN